MLDLRHRIEVTGPDKGPPYHFRYDIRCFEDVISNEVWRKFSARLRNIATKYSMDCWRYGKDLYVEGIFKTLDELKSVVQDIAPFKMVGDEYIEGPRLWLSRVPVAVSKKHPEVKTAADMTVEDAMIENFLKTEVKALQIERSRSLLSDSVERIVGPLTGLHRKNPGLVSRSLPTAVRPRIGW